jgi:L-2-hydroxyglutarate oxidase
VLDKEALPAQHQSGHNSGVLHTGIYYKPGSLKAQTCTAGRLEMLRFCETEEVEYRLTGKVVVASTEAEQTVLREIYRRGKENGVRCELIGRDRLSEIEPAARGTAAIWVSEAGVVDFRKVCHRMVDRIAARDARIVPNAEVFDILERGSQTIICSKAGDFEARAVVNCAGLQADRIAKLTLAKLDFKIVPFRGEYYELLPKAAGLIRNLVYPVPDPRFPFLGVHFTRRFDGRVECGPNAVLALGRECYNPDAVDARDLIEVLSYPGFLRLARRYLRMGVAEAWRSASKRAFVRALQTLVPQVRADDLAPAPAGIRAQAVSRDGRLVDDFLIVRSGRAVNVCNAPSPAATASLRIGAVIADRVGALL